MHPTKKSPEFHSLIIPSNSQRYEPHVVPTIYEKHNISVFLNLFGHPFSRPSLQLPNFYEKNPRSTSYFVLDTIFVLCL